jgi:outer membrane protein OmpA-like peptidoglycan-associated protein
MKKASAIGALLFLATPLSAMAQSYPDDSVTANIGGASGGGYVLYPGGQSGRYVGGLLQPGEKPGTIIHLHMPTHHRVTTAVVRKPRAPKVATAASAPAAPVYQGGPSAMPEDSAGRLVSDGGVAAAAPPPPPAAKPVKPRRVASTPPPAATAPAPAPADTSGTVPFSFDPSAAPAPAPTRTARATPPPAATGPSPATQAGLKRQTVISFAAGDTSPAASDVNVIHGLAASLNSALSSGSAKVELEAYGGPRGDKSSDSRRLSLKRALVVRELLIEDGIPSEKIDVRAMGGADSGALDRVDVFLRA